MTGAWVTDKFRLAVDKGFRILDMSEVYEYQVTRYDPETREGGLFADYTNTFLKLNAETSGYPDWVRSPAEEERYME